MVDPPTSAGLSANGSCRHPQEHEFAEDRVAHDDVPPSHADLVMSGVMMGMDSPDEEANVTDGSLSPRGQRAKRPSGETELLALIVAGLEVGHSTISAHPSQAGATNEVPDVSKSDTTRCGIDFVIRL